MKDAARCPISEDSRSGVSVLIVVMRLTILYIINKYKFFTRPRDGAGTLGARVNRNTAMDDARVRAREPAAIGAALPAAAKLCERS